MTRRTTCTRSARRTVTLVETKGRQGTLIRQFERSAVRLAAQMAGDLDEAFEALGARVRVTVRDAPEGSEARRG